MNTKTAVIISVAIVAAAILFWYLVLSKSPQTSTTTTTTTSPLPVSSFPYIIATTVQNFYVVPLISQDFAIEIDPIGGSVSVNMWLSMYNDTANHETNLYILQNVSSSQPIIITSQQLSNEGIPYKGYPYIVINVYPSANVRISFLSP